MIQATALKTSSLTSSELSFEIIEKVLLEGDLSLLTDEQRVSVYLKTCESLGVSHITKPFEYLRLNGKLILYAKRDCTDQLRKIHGISILITARELIEGVYIVTARAKNAQGREDESTGCVFISNLKGDALSNAYMKAETKAKRRVTLSICGLGFLDESEIDSLPKEVQNEPIQKREKEIETPKVIGKVIAPLPKSLASTPSDEPRRDTERQLKLLRDWSGWKNVAYGAVENQIKLFFKKNPDQLNMDEVQVVIAQLKANVFYKWCQDTRADEAGLAAMNERGTVRGKVVYSPVPPALDPNNDFNDFEQEPDYYADRRGV